MKFIFTLFSILFIGLSSFAQIVINELDCDTPGVDDKEFIELLSETPNFSLDGYVLVFFNGSNSGANMSYYTIDLDDYVTDINGLLLIGSNFVSPVPQLLIPVSVIQNGADAVAIYQADDLDFEEPTVAYVDETLIDVLLYETSDSDGQGLLTIFSEFDPNIEIINEGSGNNTNSIQRIVDEFGVVTYTSTIPTPRQLNDGSGIVLNGILMSIPQTQYNEGDSFELTFTTEQTVTEDLVLNLSLNNGTFDESDYTGNILLTIPNGQNSISTTITLVDDDLDEGDEVMKISITGIPPTYLAINNNLQIRIVDNDFTVAPYGTPINPTYDVVNSTQPEGYYDSLDGLADAALRQAIQDIVAEEGVVRAQTYNDVIEILKEADENPANSNQVWLVYLEQGRAKLDFQTTSNSIGKWNREHTFPRSRGGFNSIEADDEINGIDVFWNTNADSLRHGNSDAHALRAVDGPENSSRGNQFYGQYNGPTGTLGGFKGDVARSIFYMAVRFNGLEVVNGYPEGIAGQFGDLATLLDWHRNDPPDDFEMNRNNVVYQWQFNRNPFIDQPDMVEYIWGSMMGQTWEQPLSIDDISTLKLSIYPNPTKNRIYFKGIQDATKIDIFSIDGRQLSSCSISNDSYIDLNVTSGMYLLNISSENQLMTKKIIVN
jgi:hypothetical protein